MVVMCVKRVGSQKAPVLKITTNRQVHPRTEERKQTSLRVCALVPYLRGLHEGVNALPNHSKQRRRVDHEYYAAAAGVMLAVHL